MNQHHVTENQTNNETTWTHHSNATNETSNVTSEY